MRIKCISLESDEHFPVTGLTLDGQYTVVEIQSTCVRIVNDFQEPVLYSIDQFEVVDFSIPDDWQLRVTKYCELNYGPIEFSEPGFWEKVLDNDHACTMLFNSRQKRINEPQYNRSMSRASINKFNERNRE